MKARTRKFASGGDVAAGLVGLGTLGYLLSKRDERDKERAKGNMSSIGEKSDVADRILKGAPTDTAEERQRKANMGEPEESDVQKAVGKPLPASTTSTTPSEPVKPTKPTTFEPAKTAKTAAKVPALKPGESKVVGEGKLKPYPETTKPAEKSKPYPETAKPAAKPEPKPAAKGKKSGVKQLSEDSPEAKAMREQRKQRLGSNYVSQKRALDTAPEGPGKEALKKSVEKARKDYEASPMKRGGIVKSSASSRGDGIAKRGKTRGRIY